MWTVEQKRALIELGHPDLSVARQCALVGLPRSSLYYQPGPDKDPAQTKIRRICT